LSYRRVARICTPVRTAFQALFEVR